MTSTRISKDGASLHSSWLSAAHFPRLHAVATILRHTTKPERTGSAPARLPVPWQRAEKSSVSRTVSCATCVSHCSTSAAVRRA